MLINVKITFSTGSYRFLLVKPYSLCHGALALAHRFLQLGGLKIFFGETSSRVKVCSSRGVLYPCDHAIDGRAFFTYVPRDGFAGISEKPRFPLHSLWANAFYNSQRRCSVALLDESKSLSKATPRPHMTTGSRQAPRPHMTTGAPIPPPAYDYWRARVAAYDYWCAEPPARI